MKTWLCNRKGLGALAPAGLGLALLLLSMIDGTHPIDGSEAQGIKGGVATCNLGSASAGTAKGCMGACATNPEYNAVGANGTYVSTPPCGTTCGGTYKGTSQCAIAAQ